MNIFSRNKKKKLIGIVFRASKTSSKRINISPINEFLQASTQKLKKNFKIKPHVHIYKKNKTKITQEIWIILKGEVEIKIYDFDKKLIKKTNLKKGDMYILFGGGHEMKVKKNNTIFYEIKNGPYNKKVKDISYF